MIKQIIKAFIAYRSLREKVKLLTLIGENHKITPNTIISLRSGSLKKNIVLGNNVSLHDSVLISEAGGKITLDNNVKVGIRSKLFSLQSITIGQYTAIGDDVTIVDNNNHPISPSFRRFMRTTESGSDARMWKHSDSAPILIGENVWIGTNSRICKGVTIGDNSIIAACAVVTKNVPANSIAAGNPAKIVKSDIDLIAGPTTCDAYNVYIAEKLKNCNV